MHGKILLPRNGKVSVDCFCAIVSKYCRMLSGRAVLLQLFWTSVSCVLADDESSTQGKSENILESLERSMHPELMKVLCLQDHSPHPQLLLSNLSVRGVFWFLCLQLWGSWAGTKSLVGSLLSHLSVSWMELHGLKLFLSSKCGCLLLPAFFFRIAISLYCPCTVSMLCTSSCITKATWKTIILFWLSSFPVRSVCLCVARH